MWSGTLLPFSSAFSSLMCRIPLHGRQGHYFYVIDKNKQAQRDKIFQGSYY